MGRLDGKAAIVTGSASGIGKGIALRFAKEGAAVGVSDLNTEWGEQVARECKAASGRAFFQRADVTSEADIKALVELAVKEFGKLDIMYNNAGQMGAYGPIEATSLEDWDRTLAVLLRSVMLGMKYAVPQMRKIGGGSIISTASIAGTRAGGGPHAYSAAKAAVINLTRSVALEVGKWKIRVNCICPGGINTPMVQKISHATPEQVAAGMSGLQPMGREGRPEDIAAMAVFLASDESEWITGAPMPVDGGAAVGDDMLARLGGSCFPPTPGFAGPSFLQ